MEVEMMGGVLGVGVGLVLTFRREIPDHVMFSKGAVNFCFKNHSSR